MSAVPSGDPGAAERDWLALAEATLPSGFNSENAVSLVVAEALIGIGYELRRIGDALHENGSGMSIAEMVDKVVRYG